MSVREEDRRKNSCSSRGLGLAAAAIGVGVGAALYYFFSKRPEQADSQGSTSEGWTCEEPQTFDALASPKSSKSEYSTISENTTTDTSIRDIDFESNELNMNSRSGNSHQRASIDLSDMDSDDDMSCNNCCRPNCNKCYDISVASETLNEDGEITDSNEFLIDDGSNDSSLNESPSSSNESPSSLNESPSSSNESPSLSNESPSSSNESPEEHSDMEEEDEESVSRLDPDSPSAYSHIDLSEELEISTIDLTDSPFDVEIISDSDISNEWDVTHSSANTMIPRDDILQQYFRIVARIGGNLISPIRRNTPTSEEEQMAILRDQSFRERKWSLEECSICFEIMLRDQELMSLPCTHNFHVACIGPWLQEQQTCPVCRKAAE